MSELKTHKLCCYLFKEKYKKIDDVLMKEKMIKESYSSVDTLDEDKNSYLKGYIKRNSPNKPIWLSKIKELFDVEDIVNVSNSFIFFVETDARIFAFTNGYSNSVIDYSKIEWDFGVIVALNLLTGNEIRGIDTRKMSLSTHQRREIASVGTNLNEYEFDFNQELLDSITGRSLKNSFGKSITGKESLHINAEINLSEIKDYCKKILEVYNKKDYMRKFPFYGNLIIIKDDDIYEKFLNEFKLVLKEKNTDKIQFLYPDIDDFTFYNYRFIYNRKRKDYDDITMENLFDFIDEKNIDIDEFELKKFKIKISYEERIKEYSLSDYLVLEFENSGHKYIHTKNIIYQIDNKFYESINSEIDACEKVEIDDIGLLPICEKSFRYIKGKFSKGLEYEGPYNEIVSKLNSKNFVCLDKNNFRNFPERPKDQVEICDIITKNKYFICNKFYKHTSSHLSHLFMQGLVSATMLCEVKAYREKINKSVLVPFGENFINVNNLNRSEITFVYGIGLEKEGKISELLPFFSKISLRQNIRDLKKLDYNIQLVRIPICKQNPSENI